MRTFLLATVPLLMAGGAAAQVPAPLAIAQLQYDGGGDWYANATGLPNLLKAIRARTGLPVAERPGTMRLTDPSLWTQPYLYVTGHGTIHFSDEEVAILRRYLEGGGFLHADDNYGMDPSFRREIAKVFPGSQLTELPPDHPVFHAFYDFPQGLPKIHLHDGKAPQAFGLFHRGRLVVFYSYESDLGNGWEDAEVHEVSRELREQALRMGVNLFVYAMAQAAT